MGIKVASEVAGTGLAVNNRREFNFRHILRIISILIPLAVIGNITYAVIGSESGIWEKLSQYRVGYLFLAAVLVLIPLGCHTLRLMLWSRKFEVKLTATQSLKTALIADIGSAATPTIIGGGYLKLLFLIGYGFTPARATLLMVLGTIEDILFFSMALPVVIYFTHAWNNQYVLAAVGNLISHWPMIAGLAVGIMLLIYFYRWKKNRHKKQRQENSKEAKEGLWDRIIGRFKHYKDDFTSAVRFVLREGKSTLILAMVISGIGWSCRYFAINALILGLGYEVDPLLYTLLHWVVFSTMTMIPTPGAVGGAELSFALVFSGLLPSSIIPVMTGVWRFITFYMEIALGSVYLAVVGPGFRKNSDA